MAKRYLKSPPVCLFLKHTVIYSFLKKQLVSGIVDTGTTLVLLATGT
jgi:hypothetical protein